MENDKKDVKNVHKGHRERLREKVIKNGINSLAEHEVMELILFYSIAQKNTNGIAHKLIEEFGSVSAVLDAPESELLKIEGISKTTAFVLKSLPEISAYYMEDKLHKNALYIRSTKQAYDIVAPKYIGKVKEVVMALFMDNSGRLLSCEEISRGTVNATSLNSRKIIELCIKYNATQVILSHNHPSGNASPSFDDFVATKNLNTALHAMNSRVIDHIIVTDGGYVSMESMKQFKNAFE